MNSRHNLARAHFMVNKGCDWLSDSSSSRWMWLLSWKKVPWNFIVYGAILIKFRLIVVLKLIVDSSTRRYFYDQHMIIYLSSNFGNLTPYNRKSLNLT